MKIPGQAASLQGGASRIDITPDEPVSMGGYGQRAGKVSAGVYDALFAKALFLADGNTRLLFITTDLISIPNAIYRRVLAGLTSAGVAEPAGICITASHTHSGPDVEASLIVAAPTKEYIDRLVQALIQVGRQAASSLVPVQLRLATGQADFLINRRQEGEEAPIDRRVLVIGVERVQDQKPLAILFGVGCHAVCLGHDNLLISADYPGYAQRKIEQGLDGGIALFVNLTEGNIIPCTRPRYDSLDTRGYLGGSFADAEKVGDSLAKEVLRCLADALPQDLNLFYVDKRTFRVRPARRDLSLISAWKRLLARRKIILEYLPDFRKASPFNLKPVFTLWRDASSVVIERGMSENEMRRLMAAVSEFLMMAMRLTNPAIRKPIPVSVQVIQMNTYRLLTLPGEALVEVGRGWQECNRPHEQAAFVIGLANGFMGYLPHPDNFAEPGADLKYETIMNALEPEATLLALKQARQMLKV